MIRSVSTIIVVSSLAAFVFGASDHEGALPDLQRFPSEHSDPLAEVPVVIAGAQGEEPEQHYSPRVATVDGCLDWQPGGSIAGVDGPVYATIVWNDGAGEALYVGGDFSFAGGVAAENLAKWDGVVWSAVETGLSARVKALATYQGELVVGGDFTFAGAVGAAHIVRWDGASWSPLGSGTSTSVEALITYKGDLIAGGTFTTAGASNSNYIARWDGAAWHTLGTGMNQGAVVTLAVYDDRLIAGGGFTAVDGVNARNIASWNGTSWSALGSGMTGLTPTSFVSALIADGDDLIAGGYFTTVDGVSAVGVARWDGASWSAMPGFASLTPASSTVVRTFRVFEDALYAAGQILIPEPGVGWLGVNIAHWDGAQWLRLPPGQPAGLLFSMCEFQSRLFVGGGSVGVATSHSNIAAYDGESWSAVGSWGDVDAPVASFTVFNGDLIAGGRFKTAGEAPAPGVARWDGKSWSPLGSGLGSVSSLAVHGDALIAGGYFTVAGGASANRIASWNGLTWSPLGDGMDDGGVLALAVFDGELVAGGEFTASAGAPLDHVARWNGKQWLPLGGGFDGTVYALAVFDDGDGPALYAGGIFASADGIPNTAFIAKWSGASWSPLGTGMGVSQAIVYALGVYDGELIVAGSFGSVAGVEACNYIARWNGSSWLALGNGLSHRAYALTVFDDGKGPALYAGGALLSASGVSADRVARWDGNAWSAMGNCTSPSFCGVSNSARALTQYDGQLIVGGEFTSAGDHLSAYLARWAPTFGDLDADHAVGPLDVGPFGVCLEGPGTSAHSACHCADSDNDGDVDLADFAYFQTHFALAP